MALTRLQKLLTLACGLILLVGVGACGVTFVSTPPPEAVLAGAWKVAFVPDTGLDETLIFDANGRLSERRIKVGTTTVSQTDVHRLTRVTGNAVHIETSDNNVFDGTLNDAKNVISGDYSTIIVAGGTTISNDNGLATLTKQ